MSDDGKLSQKDFAKKLRKAAYQRAKEQRARDPRVIAMKEAAKVQRREAYRRMKEQRKAVAAEQKAQQEAERARESTEKDLGLMKLVWTVPRGPYSEN
jgi:hypothetical protein